MSMRSVGIPVGIQPFCYLTLCLSVVCKMLFLSKVRVVLRSGVGRAQFHSVWICPGAFAFTIVSGKINPSASHQASASQPADQSANKPASDPASQRARQLS